MSNAQYDAHTPGPWYVTGSSEQGTVHGGPDHRLIVPHAPDAFRRNETEDWANRRLIAAAPDMLAALETMLPRFEDLRELAGHDRHSKLADKARAAIAAARGR